MSTAPPKIEPVLKRRLEFGLCLIWLGVVVFTTAHHEYYRDEVRALSVVRMAKWPWELYGLARLEGHPLLWYLVLYTAISIADTSLVLPILSVCIAFAGIAVFVFRSPFPVWFKALFIFSALPLYEYSVMTRNYGISMLLFFLAAAMYSKRRQRPVLLATVLALLPNTNAHSAIIVGFVAAAWVWDVLFDRGQGSLAQRLRAHVLPFGIILLGAVCSVICAWPKGNMINMPQLPYMGPKEVRTAFKEALIHPEKTFTMIVAEDLPDSASRALIFIALLGLLPRFNLFLALFGTQLAFGTFFRIVYEGGFRHQGLYLILLLFLYWIFRAEQPENSRPALRWISRAGLYIGMTGLLLGQVVKAQALVTQDIHRPWASSELLAKYLQTSEEYRDAILVPEPDYYAESLLYYTRNKLYFPRERRFGTTVSFTNASAPRLALGELLAAARKLKEEHAEPILILLGEFKVGATPNGEVKHSFNKVLTWSAAEFEDFSKSTTLLEKFRLAYGDENYDLYALK